jgi:hypothetical protein
MYIRLKTIKGHKYAYLVQSTWISDKKTSNQKLVGYLGAVDKEKTKIKLNDILDKIRLTKKKKAEINKMLDKIRLDVLVTEKVSPLEVIL